MSAAALQEGGEGTEAEVSRPRWLRSGEIRGDRGRSGEIWGDLGRSGEMDCSGDGGACSCIPTSAREDTDSAAFSHTVARIVNGRWPMYARHEAGFTP